MEVFVAVREKGEKSKALSHWRKIILSQNKKLILFPGHHHHYHHCESRVQFGVPKFCSSFLWSGAQRWLATFLVILFNDVSAITHAMSAVETVTVFAVSVTHCDSNCVRNSQI